MKRVGKDENMMLTAEAFPTNEQVKPDDIHALFTLHKINMFLGPGNEELFFKGITLVRLNLVTNQRLTMKKSSIILSMTCKGPIS